MTEQWLQDVEAELRSSGGETSLTVVDVSDAAAVETATATLVERHGRLDIAGANAGIGGEQSAFVTGAYYPVDGGYLAR